MITIYDVLRRPLITEKSNYQSGKLHQYTFEVATAATKVLVKDAIETLFDVSVVRVNILNAPAKRSRRARSRRLLVRSSGYKKAIVTLAEGETLEMFEGVQ
ncbi:MAG: 50S ribosomal protein L23 [Chloroflexi bacterium GWB2_49_20]|nr:MAG: 50S ribosomal protein L23 [Chloroflexi bacterium GWB2_49_20]OGN76642.1 MAG: 50S ribosomal protein L23 [Chloroflexi bacterium GWC2_49_37]OGN83602.1 MAG: 50S ribosomal protein L23 [Chloroflexi bacterium GWD2_49_16]HBG74279.1 50S ribosomal protein L23 [Anaerolineae bacterium]HCC79484.1 50S ribosomal protein L23 [Anaerolineae bacterium]